MGAYRVAVKNLVALRLGLLGTSLQVFFFFRGHVVGRQAWLFFGIGTRFLKLYCQGPPGCRQTSESPLWGSEVGLSQAGF